MKELDLLHDAQAENRGMRLIVRSTGMEPMAQALPGLGLEGGEIELASLLRFLRANMSGTDFRSVGNVAVETLTSEQPLRDRAQAIIDQIKSTNMAKIDDGIAEPPSDGHVDGDEWSPR